MNLGSEESPQMAGTLVLVLASLLLLALFWLLRSGDPPRAAWAVVALLWGCGTAIMLAEKGVVQ